MWRQLWMRRKLRRLRRHRLRLRRRRRLRLGLRLRLHQRLRLHFQVLLLVLLLLLYYYYYYYYTITTTTTTTTTGIPPFSASPLASEYEPLGDEELKKISSLEVKEWPKELAVVRAFAMVEGIHEWFVGQVRECMCLLLTCACRSGC